VPITVFGTDGSFDQLTNTPEDVGVFGSPPIAALITDAARLMLTLLERCVTEKGGTYACCDADSMAIIAPETGGPVRDNITALTWADVRNIQSRFDALNPYDRTVIPGMADTEAVYYHEAAQRTLYAYSVSSKRYALYA
jgi:hypothetical protein